MICVNYRGERVLNEKLPYNEFVASMQAWDPVACERPNRVLIQLWDSHTQTHSAAPNDFMGSAVLPPEQQDDQVLRGETRAELAEAIAKRLAELRAHTGNLVLDAAFPATLDATIARFNELARTGVDTDFHRGEREVERTMFGGPVAEEPDKPNPVLYPISDTGPFYATLLVAGTLDTKGGPKVDPVGHVLDDLDEPIRGLYGVGNCVASVSASAYWAAGGTLGPIFGFALRTAEELSRVRQPVGIGARRRHCRSGSGRERQPQQCRGVPGREPAAVGRGQRDRPQELPRQQHRHDRRLCRGRQGTGHVGGALQDLRDREVLLHGDRVRDGTGHEDSNSGATSNHTW